MKHRPSVFLFAAAAVAAVFAFAAQARAQDAALIESLESRIAVAVEHMDVDAIMANYAHTDSLVVFDVLPPRQYTGWEAYKKDWQGVLAGCATKPRMEIGDLKIESDAELAFSHSIQHLVCNDKKGGKLDLTMRATDCYRKADGKWLIVHEHLSVPVDLSTGKADLSSKP